MMPDVLWLSRDPIAERGGLNLYGYVGNNPINSWDPLGLEIAYGNHPVTAGLYHSKIVITPENQARYTNDPRFQNVDANGKRFATIGAGPEDGSLTYGANRDRDVKLKCENKTPLALPSQYKDEDEAIDQLFNMGDRYNKSRFSYVLFPTDSQDKFRTGYNSNGFIKGIGVAAGFKMPSNTGAITPGYTFPVPASAFQPK